MNSSCDANVLFVYERANLSRRSAKREGGPTFSGGIPSDIQLSYI